MPDSSGQMTRSTGEIRMRGLCLVLTSLAAASAALPAVARAEPNVTTIRYAVMRDGAPIGACTFRLRRDGRQLVAEVVTHVRVKIAFVTVYRFDQTETEHWLGGELLAMDAVTDDNGTIHKVEARRQGEALSVEADGRTAAVPPTVIPAALWNAELVRQTMALNLQDGSLERVSVVDRGSEQLVLQGRPTTVHHYSIQTNFPQDVWYDRNHRLVKVEMRGSDGSTIQYQPG
jgi:uncharacterized protein DUF6134